MNNQEYLSFIQELTKILNRSKISQIEFANNDFEIKIKKHDTKLINHTQIDRQDSWAGNLPLSQQQFSGTKDPSTENENFQNTENLLDTAVKSPMVGVIYFSSSPEAEHFIKEGSKVEVGDTLFLVEAMKVFTPIKSPRSGVVKKILVNNHQVVEFDEPLVIID